MPAVMSDGGMMMAVAAANESETNEQYAN